MENSVPVVVSVQVADSGGEVRFTSFWSRQSYGTPAGLTWVVRAGGASRFGGDV